ncbi:sarcosine oxidase subunit alpha family protein [Yoonia sediminilitoris]|uniref:Sarcosine oxidase subunit alpha n=1 Tax=Yoonia sediminilitoris TaxID=1286148 RepID=A0A2T6KB08_9RHOB|nr:sarcosine oxidase subunit alpha family protein [Yoonia sediminilitoris]PUB12052.1 sarcosine oxidase subunit alpha [Yoonia sediminilitoris]RCW92879.1 sarcosine oxidase subunit alpha [Yoonia sediminilitoris]
METKRLDRGGRIDRSRPLTFTFNGKGYSGYEGDTLASALLANDVRLTARSFKYHRPRGIVGAGVEEPSTLVELMNADASGNQPATTVTLSEGLVAKSVNCWPSPGFDIGAVNQLAARFIPAGFYYKTFKWPNWHLYEPAIRKAAGLSAAPSEPPAAGQFEARYGHCDLLIAGSGPSGLMAALTSARAGLRVIIADEGCEAGGALLSRKLTIGGAPAMDWVAEVVAELVAMPNVTHLQNATVWGYREHNYLMVTERSPDNPSLLERTWRVRACHVITATGAIERGLVFGNNDRPGVMLASAVQTYVNRYGVVPGKRPVIFTNNNSAYAVAADLVAAGITIVAIIDSRDSVPEEARALVPGVEVMAGKVVTEARGGRRLRGVVVAGKTGGSARRLSCDLLTITGGWNPTVHLWSQSRSSLRYDETLSTFLPDTPAQAVSAVGAADGALALQQALRSGAEAVARLTDTELPEIPHAPDLPYAIEPIWRVETARGKSFLDLQNDVTVDDVHLALREGYSNVEHVKRYTTGGMGIDQGKTGNINIIGTVALAQGVTIDAVGTTTFRAPYTPVSFGAIGGLREETVALPYRHTPITDWNLAQGAFMYESGARWRRPGYFPKGGEGLQEATNRECRAVRFGVGVYDGSPLGTFELKGRDVGRFLDYLYSNVMSSLKPGNGRYGLMLSDDGLIIDDGVCFRLDDHRWIVSTSTGHADAINGHMEEMLQTRFPEWNVFITAVTSQWNNATICGPKAREVMEALGTDIDLSPDAFPFMSLRDGTVAGLPVRLVRVSFTGELSYEVNVAPRHMRDLWAKVMEAGQPFGILPVGSEASHVLRVEKGFLSLGHEVDGTVDAYDLGMGWSMSKKKPDYLGKRAVHIRRETGGVRRELVGVISKSDRQIPEGAPLTPGGRKEKTEGFVTACVWSVVHDRWVGLALLEGGHSRHGETAHVRLKGGEVIPVRVTVPCHYDHDGEKLRS